MKINISVEIQNIKWRFIIRVIISSLNVKKNIKFLYKIYYRYNIYKKNRYRYNII